MFLTAACITGGLAIIALLVGRKRASPPRSMKVIMVAIFFCILFVAPTAPTDERAGTRGV